MRRQCGKVLLAYARAFIHCIFSFNRNSIEIYIYVCCACDDWRNWCKSENMWIAWLNCCLTAAHTTHEIFYEARCTLEIRWQRNESNGNKTRVRMRDSEKTHTHTKWARDSTVSFVFLLNVYNLFIRDYNYFLPIIISAVDSI